MGTVWKGIFAAALAAVMAYLRELTIPLVVLLIVMVLDWISGVTAAWITKQLSSRIGLVGILKKLCYLLIVVVGMVLDYLIQLLGGRFGLTLDGVYFVGLVVIVWLIVNECISILENADEMGLPVPPFVGKLLERLKRHTEDAGGTGEE